MNEIKVFWACGEFYRGSGRLSRPFVVETTSGSRPDAWSPCNELGACELMGRSRRGWACIDDNGHVPYPFNGMGGEVVSGPYGSEAEAIAALPYEED